MGQARICIYRRPLRLLPKLLAHLPSVSPSNSNHKSKISVRCARGRQEGKQAGTQALPEKVEIPIQTIQPGNLAIVPVRLIAWVNIIKYTSSCSDASARRKLNFEYGNGNVNANANANRNGNGSRS